MPYVRHTAMPFDPSNYDTMMAYMTTMFEMADNAVQEDSGMMAGMAEFTTGASNVREASVIWSHNK